VSAKYAFIAAEEGQSFRGVHVPVVEGVPVGLLRVARSDTIGHRAAPCGTRGTDPVVLRLFRRHVWVPAASYAPVVPVGHGRGPGDSPCDHA